MSVPQAAIEAGARAAYAHVSPQHAHDQGWDELAQAWQRNYLNEALRILEAAAPHIRAQTAEVIANGLQSWGGVAERSYVQGFAEAAWGKCDE
jgi:hypothetical protein